MTAPQDDALPRQWAPANLADWEITADLRTEEDPRRIADLLTEQAERKRERAEADAWARWARTRDQLQQALPAWAVISDGDGWHGIRQGLEGLTVSAETEPAAWAAAAVREAAMTGARSWPA